MGPGRLAGGVRQEDQEQEIGAGFFAMSEKVPVVIYGDEYCAYCAAARMLFTKKGII